MTITNVRPAQALRAALKSAGFNARRVTVREDDCTLRVTIRDAAASITEVNAVAAPFERIRRCQATGVIIVGGSVYVEVAYSNEVLAPVQAAIVAILESAPVGQSVAVLGGFRARKVVRDAASTFNGEIHLEGPGPAFEIRNPIAYGVPWAALRLAVAYLDACARGAGPAV
jgi:hypothetical protein